MSAIAFSGSIGPVPLNVIVSESHAAEIEITGNPIETGAEVNDHAYIMPKRVTLDVADGNAAATYAALVRFQETRRPFILVTGLSVYRNMLIKALSADRDASFSRVLRCTADLQEVIIVDTAYAAAEGGEGEAAGAGNTATRAARPSPSRSLDTATANRASGTVQRGDMPTRPAPLIGSSPAAVQNQAMVARVFG